MREARPIQNQGVRIRRMASSVRHRSGSVESHRSATDNEVPPRSVRGMSEPNSACSREMRASMASQSSARDRRT